MIEISGYMQVVPQTHEEKVAMYMKCTKKQLVEMVIECNRILDTIKPTVTTATSKYCTCGNPSAMGDVHFEGDEKLVYTCVDCGRVREVDLNDNED